MYILRFLSAYNECSRSETGSGDIPNRGYYLQEDITERNNRCLAGGNIT